MTDEDKKFRSLMTQTALTLIEGEIRRQKQQGFSSMIDIYKLQDDISDYITELTN